MGEELTPGQEIYIACAVDTVYGDGFVRVIVGGDNMVVNPARISTDRPMSEEDRAILEAAEQWRDGAPGVCDSSATRELIRRVVHAIDFKRAKLRPPTAEELFGQVIDGWREHKVTPDNTSNQYLIDNLVKPLRHAIEKHGVEAVFGGEGK